MLTAVATRTPTGAEAGVATAVAGLGADGDAAGSYEAAVQYVGGALYHATLVYPP